MFDKEEALNLLDTLIQKGEALRFEYRFLRGEQAAAGHYWLTETVSAVNRIFGNESFYYAETVHLARRSRRQGGIIHDDVQMLLGHLGCLRDAVSDDRLTTIQDEIAAADFTDFLTHARSYYAKGRKMESSTIASALFEDTIRRLAHRRGIDRTVSVDQIISALARHGHITGTEAKKYRYCGGLRNAALHASWDEFDLDDVEDLIEGTAGLIRELGSVLDGNGTGST